LAKLVDAMRDIPEEKRGAHFACVLYLIGPDGAGRVFEGRCPGRLLREPRGGGGFGYDPLFVPDGHERTFSELDEAEKNKLSHRGRAWIEMSRFLNTIKQ
jgi:XTP/dITP diphosphohydrolase